MKIKNGAVLMTVLPALETLGRKETPILTALKIRKMVKLLRDHAQIVSETRNEFLDRFGKKGENGKLLVVGTAVQFADGDQAKFVVAQNELYEGEWDYTGQTITVADLGQMKVSGTLLADLGELFREAEVEQSEKKEK